ncbi:NAD-dependent epimerase/dehydratase family protein [Lentzea jiangxiensis]|uniref:NAD-dependent epimerase/dehydratase family protein n=1 Tax=Lentzea jiangxiensis TaxID=641025 RepID=UPI001C40991C|nr:NAD-dependent epimerase/dehydratase family protein [Lentzea jiangxiensis]
MAEHVIIGAGSIGTNVARLLVERGDSVRIVTRSGSGPAHPLVERVAADASDPLRMTQLSRGAKAIYHCANPTSYTLWERLSPPLRTAVIAAAKANDAVLALTGSLYAYGPQPDGRMDEHTPMSATGRKGRLRKRMWEQALGAGIRTTEVRGSDYIGKDAVGIYSMLIEPALKKGRAAWITGHLDMPHTFTFNGDMAKTLVTLARTNAHGVGPGTCRPHQPSPSASSHDATPSPRAGRRPNWSSCPASRCARPGWSCPSPARRPRWTTSGTRRSTWTRQKRRKPSA